MVSGVAKGGPGWAGTHPNLTISTENRSIYPNRAVITLIEQSDCSIAHPMEQAWLRHWLWWHKNVPF